MHINRACRTPNENMSDIFRKNYYRAVFCRIHWDGVKLNMSLKFVHYPFWSRSLVNHENSRVLLLNPTPDLVTSCQLFGWLGSLSPYGSGAARIFTPCCTLKSLSVIYSNLTKARVIWEERSSIGKMPPADRPVDKLGGHFLNKWLMWEDPHCRWHCPRTGSTRPGGGAKESRLS